METTAPDSAPHSAATTRRRSSATASYAVGPGWQLLLQDTGLQAAHVLRRAELPGDLFGRGGARLESAQYFRLWAAIDAEAGDTGAPVPLRIAQQMTSDWFDPELFAALCSADLNSALARLAHYKRLMAPMALALERNSRRTSVSVQFLDATLQPPPVLAAFKAVFLVQLARLATRSKVQPLRVGWPAPPQSAADARAYAAYFGVPVQRTHTPTVVFSAEDAQRPFLTANHGMWSFFEPALRQRLADLDRLATTVERVRGALLEALPAGALSMQAISARLGLSSRTLQRRLQDEGSSFQQTLDAVRSSLAQHYLQHSALSGAEISFLLGFEDPNSFVRAFQGWTGTTPQAARTARAGGGSRN